MWYRQWRQSPTHLEASETAVAEMPKGKTVCVKSLLRSRKHVADALRKRREGGGRHCVHPLVRQELYHWWCSIRYAIDWRQLIAENRSRGGTRKKNLARFPRSILLVKVWQLQTEYAHASLLSGVKVCCFSQTIGGSPDGRKNMVSPCEKPIASTRCREPCRKSAWSFSGSVSSGSDCL